MKIILYLFVFIFRVLSIVTLLVSSMFAILFTTAEGLSVKVLWLWVIVAVSALVTLLCQPVWKKMVEATTDHFGDEKFIPKLLESPDTPPQVKQAIHAFQQGRATLDDVAAIAPFGLFQDESMLILKEADTPGFKECMSDDFCSETDYLLAFSKIHNRNPSITETLDAFFVHLLTSGEVLQIIRQNPDYLPETIAAFQDPNVTADHVLSIYRKEIKKRNKPLIDR